MTTTTKTLHALSLALSLCAFAGTAAAHDLNVAATPVGSHVVTSTFGVENAFVASLGYGRAVRMLGGTGHLGGDFTLPWASADRGDYRLRLGALVPVLGSAGFRLLARVAPMVRGTENDVNRMTNLALETGLVGGYYGPRWFFAAELGGDWAALTHIEHSDEYRQTMYADAKDGWYRTTGATVRAGLVGGYSLGAVDVVLRAGQERDLHLETLMVPAYLTMGLNVRLPR